VANTVFDAERDAAADEAAKKGTPEPRKDLYRVGINIAIVFIFIISTLCPEGSS